MEGNTNTLLHAFLNISNQEGGNITGGNITVTASGENRNMLDTIGSQSDNMPTPTINSGNNQDVLANRSLDLNMTIGYESPLNLSLKENCLQCLSHSTCRLQPPSLFETTVDYMAWNPNIY